MRERQQWQEEKAREAEFENGRITKDKEDFKKEKEEWLEEREKL